MTITPDRYRVSSWIKTDEQVDGSYPIVFGIEARISPRKWAHLTDGAYPRFYRRPEEAEAEVKRLNALARKQNQ
jgi:hypothetical protein